MKIKTLILFSLLLVTALAILPISYTQVSGTEIKKATGNLVTTLPNIINWTQFWKEFNKHSVWSLQWYNETSSSWVSAKNGLTIQRKYPKDNTCKITLIFNAFQTGSYRLVFGIDYRVKNYITKLDRYQYELEYEGFIVTFDWSDVMNISGLIINHGVKEVNGIKVFWFSMRKDNIPKGAYVEIDPSIIGTSTTEYATSYPFQRKTFYANGRFWVFYSDGTNMVYRTSTDGSTWTSPTTITSCSAGYGFSIWFDGTYLHYARGSFYRKGTPNADGTISWCDSEQDIGVSASYPVIAVDSEQHPWILYYGGDNCSVIKSAWTNGTWSTASGFPYQLDTTYKYPASIVPLSSGKVYVMWGWSYSSSQSGFSLYGKLWDGSSWGSKETIGTILYTYTASAVAIGDTIHLVFCRYADPPGDYHLAYLNRTSSGWGTARIIASGRAGPVISKDEDDNLYVFWAEVPTANHTYYCKYDNETNTWSNNIDWLDESSQGLTNKYYTLSSFYEKYDGYIGLMYMTKKSSPYNVKFETFTFYNLTLRIKDANGLVISNANATVTYTNETGSSITSSKITDNNGLVNWSGSFTGCSIPVKVKYQDVWVYGSSTVTLNSNNPINITCKVYSLTVYVTDENNEEKSGATVTLTRSDGTDLTAYGITSKTASYYNSTHAKCFWTQLANQSSSYTVTATYSGYSESVTTSLTSNTEKTITLPAGSQGGTTTPSVFSIRIKITTTKNQIIPSAYVKIYEKDTNITVWAGYTDENGLTEVVTLKHQYYVVYYEKEGVWNEETIYPTESKTYVFTLGYVPPALPPEVENYAPYISMAIIAGIIAVASIQIRSGKNSRRSSSLKNMRKKWRRTW